VAEFPGGGREQALPSVDRAFLACVRAVREKLGPRWRAVRGIGIAAQGGSSIIARRGTGKPLTSMILWNDGRTRSYSSTLARRHPRDFWFRQTLGEVPPDGLGRLAWLREEKPALFCDENIHVGAGEHLFFRMTGVWRQDAGNAIQIGSYHAREERLDPTLLDLIGLPLSFVAPLRRGHETSPLSRSGARWLGLEPGIPVAGPYLDQEAGYLSAVGAARRPLHASLGTAWVGNFVLPASFSGSSPTQLVLPAPAGDGRLVVQPLLAGNPTWDWALARFAGGKTSAGEDSGSVTLAGEDSGSVTLAGEDSGSVTLAGEDSGSVTLAGEDSGSDPLARAARVFSRSLLPPRGLVMLPWLSQSNPLQPAAYGGGACVGLSDQTSADDLLRAAACGLAFEFLRMFESIRDEKVVGSIVLGGGASKGACFRALMAGLFAPLPVLQQQEEDQAVARGSVFAFNPEGGASTTQPARPPPPDILERLREGYDEYIAAFERIYGAPRSGQPFQVRRRKP
jgi:sugar (pentulose or hexulose) kinase